VAFLDSALVFGGALAAVGGDGAGALVGGLVLAPVCWACALVGAVRRLDRWTSTTHPGALEGVAGAAMLLCGVRLLWQAGAGG
jgi:threonine/homoserine/homoserine lactone efflux protein